MTSTQPIESTPNQALVQETYTLNEMRKRSGVSGARVAEICGVSYQGLRNWETGIRIPNVIITMELLQVYGYTIEQLDLTPFYKEVDARTDDEKKAKTQLALNRLDEMRRQHAPDAT